MKMTKFNLENFKIAEGINKEIKVKCRKLGRDSQFN